MALAVHDRAFRVEKYNDVRNLLGVNLPDGIDHIVIRWRDDCKDRPVFRISAPGREDRELPANTSLKRLSRLGLNSGY